MTPEQLPLDLGHRTAFAREDFWVSDSNREAVAWLDKWPNWPAPALILYGPPGCGKTHLLHVWRQETEGKTDKAAIIDDIDKQIGDHTREEEILHLYNSLKESGGHMLVTAGHAPRAWNFVLPDLKSRLMAAPVVGIGSPDDQLMSIVLAKFFSDRQTAVPAEVVQFILTRSDRSFAALRALAEKIDHRALSEKRAVTIPLVRDILNSP